MEVAADRDIRRPSYAGDVASETYRGDGFNCNLGPSAAFLLHGVHDLRKLSVNDLRGNRFDFGGRTIGNDYRMRNFELHETSRSLIDDIFTSPVHRAA